MRRFTILFITLTILAGCGDDPPPAVVISQGLTVPDRLRDCPVTTAKPPPDQLPSILDTQLLREIALVGIAYAKAVKPTVRLCPARLRGLNSWIGANTVAKGKTPLIIPKEEDYADPQ